MRRFAYPSLFVIAISGLAAPALCAQDQPTGEARLQKMTVRAATLKMQYADAPDRQPPTLMKAPVLRCSDPTRDEVDGALWLWIDGQRPVAALCLLYYTSGKWNYENLLLSDEPVTLTGRPGWSWRPKPTPREWVTVDQPVPEAARARQQALRELARRMEASEVRRGERFPLRLLERPIYSYADPQHGILDGAVFSISNGTNPEILALLEAAQADGKAQWRLSFGRLTAAEATVKLDGKELWNVPATNSGRQNPTDPYYALNEFDDPQ